MTTARIAHLRAAIVETLERRCPGATVFVLDRERVSDRTHRARAVAEGEGAEPFEAEGPRRPSELGALEELARALGATRTAREQLPSPARLRTGRETAESRRDVQ